jgi:uncharacterized membrane protein
MKEISQIDIITLVIASITLVITNSWNNLFKEIIDRFYPNNQSNAITAQILYTIIITVYLVTVVYLLKKYGSSLVTKIEEALSNLSLKFKIKVPQI